MGDIFEAILEAILGNDPDGFRIILALLVVIFAIVIIVITS